MESRVKLKEKFFACIAATHIGSAMGAQVRDWEWAKIEKEYGLLDKFVAYEHGWKREPGTTEDGVERQKLLITAMIEKQNRVTAEDVRKVWLRDIKPESFGMLSEAYESRIYDIAKTVVPARDFGRYADFSGLDTFAHSCHPVGLINAGDPVHALEDILELGQLYHINNGRSINWAAVVGVAVAEAAKPGASVDSVIGKIFDLCNSDLVLRELDKQLKYSEDCKDFKSLRTAFDTEYYGHGMPNPYYFANEVVTKAICVFRMVGGDPKEAIIASVNFGRDTSCLAAISAGISGALSGAASIPKEWVEQVDRATSLNVYTANKRTLRESADGMYDAYKARLCKLNHLISLAEGGRPDAANA